MAASEKGMLVHVYRTSGWDCTNGGPSATVDNFTVVGVMRRSRGFSGDESIEEMPRDSRVFEPSDRAPAAILVAGAFPGCPPNLVPLETLEKSQERGIIGPMSGGNIADSSDSRWRELVSGIMKADGAVAPGVLLMVSTVDIFDRVETTEQYNALSI
jgi:hypothetical protein